MTEQERKRFEDFERDLRNYPVKRMMFLSNMVKEEDRDYQHLGIAFREEEHRFDEVAVAKEWAATLPDMNY